LKGRHHDYQGQEDESEVSQAAAKRGDGVVWVSVERSLNELSGSAI
jgi:hypothetical protein